MADSWHSTIFTVSGGHFLNNSNGTVGATRFLRDNSHTVEGLAIQSLSAKERNKTSSINTLSRPVGRNCAFLL